MNLTEAQDQYIVTLAPGEAAVFADGADYPWLVRMPDGTAREAGNAAAVSPAGIISPRSATCGADCQVAPCTLRQMRRAQRAAETDPRITLWAELAVLGHLTGWTMPLPGREFAGALQAMDARLRDCALAHAVDDAVAQVSAVAWGVRPDAAIERAVGARAGDQDCAERLASQLGAFGQRCRWPLDYLKPPDPSRQETAAIRG